MVTWNTVGPNVDRGRFSEGARIFCPGGYESNEGKSIACVNPLTWREGEESAGSTLHLGAVIFLGRRKERPTPDAGQCSAQCWNGLLKISRPAGPKYYERMRLGPDDYHLYDYPLFYMDLRRNVELRVSTFVKKRILFRSGKLYRFVDPFFGEWVKLEGL